jgi:SAM-dependent methyltransferase
MANWVTFWDSEHSIYVNARHRDEHYRRLAEDLRRYVPRPDAAVLDYGCGEALHADRIADAAGRLILCEAAPNVRAALAARFAAKSGIEVRTPDEVAALPDHCVDLIILHSVAQYLAPQELDAILILFRRIVAADGVLLLGDVIPPNVSAVTDAAALLGFAAANGFFWAAMVGLARTVLSDYWILRGKLGLQRYTEQEIIGRLAAARFSGKRAARNVGHNPARMTVVGRPI